MTTTTLLPTRSRTRARGFTLVEVLVSSVIAAWILTAVMATFLFLGRSGANIQNYNDMESQARTALELFAEDTRQASSINWESETEIYLTVNAQAIYYYYDSGTDTFYRKVTSGGTPRALVTGITAFAFKAYSITGADLPLTTADELTTATKSTKQLQISLEAARSSQTVVDATNTVLSARFILRNKRITA
jgi:prepilin-type N-terminal cleavage/methylation domain-containing protein